MLHPRQKGVTLHLSSTLQPKMAVIYGDVLTVFLQTQTLMQQEN